jgi:hypothetical protein
MKLVVLTVIASTSVTPDLGYVGLYRDMDQCKEMQGIYIKHLDPEAIMVCDPVTEKQPVLIPPPRPAGLRVVHEPVLIPPPRPSNLEVSK